MSEPKCDSSRQQYIYDIQNSAVLDEKYDYVTWKRWIGHNEKTQKPELVPQRVYEGHSGL